MLPEGPDDHVLALAHLVALEFVVHEETRDIDERRAFLLVVHERQTTVAEVVLDARTEYFVSEELQEYFHRIQGCAVLFLVRFRFE